MRRAVVTPEAGLAGQGDAPDLRGDASAERIASTVSGEYV